MSTQPAVAPGAHAAGDHMPLHGIDHVELWVGNAQQAAYTVAGEASAMLHVRARDTSHLEETLERIRDHPGVTRTQTQIVLSTLFERPFEEPPPGP